MNTVAPILIVLILLLAAAFWLVRRHFFGWMGNSEEAEPAFTLADLRELHRRGAMTDEEFERAKARVVQGVRAAAKKQEQAPRAGPGQSPSPPQNPGAT